MKMSKDRMYIDEIEEFIHPFWLGLIILFVTIILISILCILRRKCRSNLRYFYNWICCQSELNNENYVKKNKSVPCMNAYQWAPVYAPPSSVSPKLYKLVRRIRTISIDGNLPIEHTVNNEENIINNVVFSKINEANYKKTFNSNQNSEAARKFFAGLRNPSLDPHISSIDSSNIELGEQSKKKKSAHRNRLKFIRTSPFLQSIAYGPE